MNKRQMRKRVARSRRAQDAIFWCAGAQDRQPTWAEYHEIWRLDRRTLRMEQALERRHARAGRRKKKRQCREAESNRLTS